MSIRILFGFSFHDAVYMIELLFDLRLWFAGNKAYNHYKYTADYERRHQFIYIPYTTDCGYLEPKLFRQSTAD